MKQKKISGKDKVVMAVVAHPDDVEFGCGATMARLSDEGAELIFVISTQGDRGSRAHNFGKEELVISRKKEQSDAAQILGAKEVIFLDEPDGGLMADLRFKEKVVKLVRKYKPNMIFTHDPSWFYRTDLKNGASINHNDHRETGKAVLDAVYPLARDLSSFPEHNEEGLTPHHVEEVFLFNQQEANYYFDVTKYVNKKIDSIKAHTSQIDQPEEMAKRIKKRLAEIGKKAKMKYAEGFVYLFFN
jgi:LmbE family N-acetylglucosaminyl deacetylase